MSERSSGQKAVRFTQVVERSGQPRAHTLWVQPDKDPELKRALSSHRVMTLVRGSGGGKTDFGVVGFDPQRHKNGQLLIFPKSLERFEDARVIGVKFDLLEQPKIVAASGDTEESPPRHRKKRSPPPTTPKSKKSPPAPAAAKTKVSADVADEAARSRVAAAPRRSSTRDQEPAPERARAKEATSTHARAASRKRPASSAERSLAREVRAAMDELQQSKAVLAYQRLERALAETVDH